MSAPFGALSETEHLIVALGDALCGLRELEEFVPPEHPRAAAHAAFVQAAMDALRLANAGRTCHVRFPVGA